MTTPSFEALFTAASLAVLALGSATLLVWVALARPRLGLYALFAFTPTQFIFLPLGSFFISPADVLVLACAVGFLMRLVAGREHSRVAVRLHVMLGLMLVAYLVGFVIRGDFSRTLVRVPMAIVPSMLACELLRTRTQLVRAIGALIAGAGLDAAYGLFYVAMGQPLHPTRFSGMMGVNFSAMIILAGAAMAFALFSRTRQPVKLLIPVSLAALAVATLSRTGLVAMMIAGAFVLWKIATPKNQRLMLTAAAVAIVVIAGQRDIRERVLARTHAEIEQDGVERTSTDVRVRILQSAARALADRPLIGIGYFHFQAYSTRDPDIHRSTFGVGYATHNTYLEVLVEGGLLAFVPFLLHFGGYLRPLRNTWPVMLETRDVVPAAALSGLLVVLVTAWAANVLIHYLFWSIAGLALASFRQSSTDVFHTRSFDRSRVML